MNATHSSLSDIQMNEQAMHNAHTYVREVTRAKRL